MNILKIAVFATLLAGTAHAGVMPKMTPQVSTTPKTIVEATPEVATGLDQLLQFLFSVVFLVL